MRELRTRIPREFRVYEVLLPRLRGRLEQERARLWPAQEKLSPFRASSEEEVLSAVLHLERDVNLRLFVPESLRGPHPHHQPLGYRENETVVLGDYIRARSQNPTVDSHCSISSRSAGQNNEALFSLERLLRGRLFLSSEAWV